jgi:hypothetical protein
MSSIMPTGSRLALAGVVASLVLVAMLPACGTDAVNPDGCEAIESARCRAAASCDSFSGLNTDACLRFYRDQCLHGLASETDPGQPRIDQCVAAIESAGACAAQGISPCSVGPKTTADRACAVIETPEKFAECDFLLPAPGEQPAEDAATPSDADAAAAEAGGDGAADA